jgi:acetoin utilization deacetylase AcuC-like enzyme
VNKIPVYYHPGFAAPIGEGHMMPIRKFALVAEGLRDDPAAEFFEPAAATETDLLRVHTPAYIEAVRTGQPRGLAESQKFPWTPALYPSVCLTNGACLAAAEQALISRVAAALVSGFHHAHADHGEGFCTFNGLVVAADALLAARAAARVAVLDLDLHYGNGTASLAAARPYLTVLSLYGNDYMNNLVYRDVRQCHHVDGPNHFSVALPAGLDGDGLQKLLGLHLPKLLSRGRPDLLLYQAGADPYFEDPFSPLALDHAALRARDMTVFEFARSEGIPIAWVLAGGYTADVRKVVQVHLNTFEACREVYGSRKRVGMALQAGL